MLSDRSLGTKVKQTGFTLGMSMVGSHLQMLCVGCENFALFDIVCRTAPLLRRILELRRAESRTSDAVKFNAGSFM